MVAKITRQMLVRGRFSSDNDAVFVVSLEVDQEAILAQLAPRARSNKSRSSSIASGAVLVRIVEQVPR